MAKIPTIISGSSVSGRFTPGFASPSAFANDGVGAVGNALEGASRKGLAVAHYLHNTKERNVNEWANESASVIQRESAEWYANPDNAAKGDVAASYTENSQQSLKRLLATTDDPKAREALTKKYQAWYDYKIPAVKAQGYQNRDNETLANHTRINQDAAETYRITNDAAEYARTVGDSLTNIKRSFANFPKLVESETLQTLQEMVATVGPTDPAAAENILNSAEGIGEKDRGILQRQIEGFHSDAKQVARMEFTDGEREGMKLAEETGAFYVPRTEEAYILNYGSEARGVYEHGRAVKYATFINSANRIVRGTSGFAASEQTKEIKRLASQLTGVSETDRKAIERASYQMLDASRRMQEDDTAQWVYNSEPYVQSLIAMDNPYSKGKAYDIVIARQKTPDHDAKDKGKYLNKVDGEVSLLTKAQAADWASKLKVGTASEIKQVYAQITSEYEDRHLPYVLNDIVDSGVSGVHQVLLNNVDNPYFDTIADGLLKDSSALLPSDTKKAISVEIEGSSNIAVGDYSEEDPLGNLIGAFKSLGRIEDAKNYSESTRLLAGYLLGNDRAKDEEDAVKIASKMIIGEQTGIPIVNGVPVIMSRDVSGQRLDDKGVKDAARRMEITLEHIPPEQLMEGQFTFSKNAKPEERLQDIHKTIVNSGRYVMSTDSNYMNVYVPGKHGPVLLKNTEGRALRVNVRKMMADNDTFTNRKDVDYNDGRGVVTLETLRQPNKSSKVADFKRNKLGLEALVPFAGDEVWKHSPIPNLSFIEFE